MRVKNHTREGEVAAALDRNPATGDQRALRVFSLWFTVVEFKKEGEIGRYAEIVLAEDDEVADIQHRVWRDILWPDL